MIGVDFDNTIASYDEVLHDEAVKRGLVGASARRHKREIRDRVRMLPNGEIEWQRVQACIYGPRMNEAELRDGVASFFVHCRERDVRLYVVSHKTEYANFDETGSQLRQEALSWMQQMGFFAKDGMGLAVDDVYFGDTRREKISYIRDLGCTHFIDDLVELFAEDAFPADVTKVLLAPDPSEWEGTSSGLNVFSSWSGIEEFIFGAEPLRQGVEE